MLSFIFYLLSFKGCHAFPCVFLPFYVMLYHSLLCSTWMCLLQKTSCYVVVKYRFQGTFNCPKSSKKCVCPILMYKGAIPAQSSYIQAIPAWSKRAQSRSEEIILTQCRSSLCIAVDCMSSYIRYVKENHKKTFFQRLCFLLNNFWFSSRCNFSSV